MRRSKRTVVALMLAASALALAVRPTVAPAAPPPNDNKANATVIPSLPFEDHVSTVEATSVGDPTLPCGGGGKGATVWYKYTPSLAENVCVQLCGSSYDTVAAIGKDSAGGAFVSLSCNDDSCELQSRTIAAVPAGVPVYVHLASYSASSGGELRVHVSRTGLDSDGDGVADCDDNCELDPNASQTDADGDEVGDVCEACPTCRFPRTDADGDGRCDSCDPCPNDVTNQCPTLFGCTGVGEYGGGDLFRIDPNSGAYRKVGSMGIDECQGLAIEPATGTLYGAGLIDGNLQVFTVDKNTAAVTSLTSVGGATEFSDLSFRSDGTLFAFKPSSTIGTMDLGLGDFLPIGDTSQSGSEGNGITFTPADVLYHADDVSLNILDQATGLATEVAPLDFPLSSTACPFPSITGLEFRLGSTVFGAMSCADTTPFLVRIDTNTGIVTMIGPTVPDLASIAGTTLCGNGVLDLTEECDDGNAASGDCCSSTCQYDNPGTTCTTDGDPCTSDVCDGAGQCTHPFGTGPCADDGNPCTNDVCNGAGTCTHPNNSGGPCDDGNVCTVGDTCAAGTCVGGPPASCANGCLTCVPGNGCMTVISTGCHEPIISGKSAVQLKRGANPLFDTVRWKWVTGDATDPSTLGDPTTGSGSYTLCVYDETAGVPSVALHAAAPFGGTCANGKPCWKATGNGYRYKDAIGTPDGLLALSIRGGGPGQSRVVVRGRGPALGLPALPLHQDTKVTVQLKKNGGGACFDATYHTSTRNTGSQFGAKAD